MNKLLKFKRAVELAKKQFAVLTSRYGSEIAKKAFYLIARTQSHKENLLRRREQLEKELKAIKKKV